MCPALILSILGLLAQAEPLEVIARIPPGRYVAGQAIEVRLGIVAAGDRPEVTAPKIPADRADVVLMGRDFRQVGASGIGEMVTESNLYIERYLVIPRRPGTLDIPPFQAALEDRRGASRPLKVEVHPVPSGRPATFLGGVGGLVARAGISSDRVRLGEALEYSLTLEGPGARGSLERPTLAQAMARNPGLEVRPGRDDLVQNPPTRTLRWSLRPSRAGAYVMPPVLVSTYNPRTGQFDTRSAPSVGFEVADVPRFQESDFRYGSGEVGREAEDDREVEVIERPAAFGILGLALATSCILLARRSRRRREPLSRARRLARKVLGELGRVAREDVPGWTSNFIGALVALDPAGPGDAGTLDPRRLASAVEAIGFPPLLRDRLSRLCREVEGSLYGGRPVDEGFAAEVRSVLMTIARG